LDVGERVSNWGIHHLPLSKKNDKQNFRRNDSILLGRGVMQGNEQLQKHSRGDRQEIKGRESIEKKTEKNCQGADSREGGGGFVTRKGSGCRRGKKKKKRGGKTKAVGKKGKGETASRLNGKAHPWTAEIRRESRESRRESTERCLGKRLTPGGSKKKKKNNGGEGEPRIEKRSGRQGGGKKGVGGKTRNRVPLRKTTTAVFQGITRKKDRQQELRSSMWFKEHPSGKAFRGATERKKKKRRTISKRGEPTGKGRKVEDSTSSKNVAFSQKEKMKTRNLY